MWEFRNRNVFGATVFSTYGGFWLSLGGRLLATSRRSSAPPSRTTNLTNSLAWFLFAFAIFNTYMLLWELRVNVAVFLVFLTLDITEILLVIGFFNISHGGATGGCTRAAGAGIVTAAVAWYTSAAGVVNGMAPAPPCSLSVPRPSAATRVADAGRERGVKSGGETGTARDRHDAPRGAALPAVRGVRRAGEREGGDLRRGLRGVLGASGARAAQLVRALRRALRWEPPYAKWYLGGKLNVCSTASTAMSRPATATRSRITGRASRRRPTVGRAADDQYADLQRDVVRFANALKRSACARARRWRSTWAWSRSCRWRCSRARASARRTRSSSAASRPTRSPAA